MQTITKVYDDYDSAKQAVRELEAAGIPSADISLVANRDVTGYQADVDEASATATSGGIGAVVGGAAGLLAGLGLMAIPGLGPVVAAGWLASTALGAVAGGAAGGIIGALVDAGVPEEEAHIYSEAVRRGGTLLSAKVADGKVATARAILERFRPIDPALRRAEFQKTGWTRYDPTAGPYEKIVTRSSTATATARATASGIASQPGTGDTRQLDNLFRDTLKDVYFAEKQILTALPKMASSVRSSELKAAFEKHRGETQGQLARLERIFELIGVAPQTKTCDAILGLIKEGETVMRDYATSRALDAAVLAVAQAVEHYEIARYGTLKAWAKELQMLEAVNLLEQTLEQEKATDQTLTELAVSVINYVAEAA